MKEKVRKIIFKEANMLELAISFILIIVITVLTITRQMIVDHFGAVEILMAILSLALLFTIRKFLLAESDVSEKSIYKGNHKVGLVNLLERIEIPGSKNRSLGQVMEQNLRAREESIEVGAVVVSNGCLLKVIEVDDNSISKIEVIKQVA